MTKKMAANMQKILNERLDDMANGLKHPDINEVLRIKAALDADRPTADLVMTVIFNQMAFLNNGGYEVKSLEENQSIMAFLESFRQYTQHEFLGKASTYRDGLNMGVQEI